MKNICIVLTAILTGVVLAVLFASLLYWIAVATYLLGIISMDTIINTFPWGYIFTGLAIGVAADIIIIRKLKEDLS